MNNEIQKFSQFIEIYEDKSLSDFDTYITLYLND